ncbi:UNVERIFIED_CONTAM: hypothetical protein FKN15_000378 [Acipenser sinensis]
MDMLTALSENYSDVGNVSDHNHKEGSPGIAENVAEAAVLGNPLQCQPLCLYRFLQQLQACQPCQPLHPHQFQGQRLQLHRQHEQAFSRLGRMSSASLLVKQEQQTPLHFLEQP